MQVLLVSTYEMGHQPLGRAAPAAALRARGHDVRCFDLAVESPEPELFARALQAAKAAVEAIAAEIKVGSVFEGKVVSTRDFGAFIEIAPGTDGMCHISELADGFVDKVENICKVGDMIKVKVINVDDTGRIKLSVKALLKDAEKDSAKDGDDSTEESASESEKETVES